MELLTLALFVCYSFRALLQKTCHKKQKPRNVKLKGVASMIDFTFTEEQEMFRKAAREFAEGDDY